MKIKILDIHSESRDINTGGGCETCEYWETYDVTSVEIEEVGTSNVTTVQFDNDDDESIIGGWKFNDWIKFADYLKGLEIYTVHDLQETFKQTLLSYDRMGDEL